MPFHQLSVQNYRAFRDQVVFELRPLTLVFGENNAGKSSLVRLLPSIANSCNLGARLAFSPITPANGSVSSLDFIYGRQPTQKLFIGATFPVADGTLKSVRYEIAALPEWSISVVSRITFMEHDVVLADFQWDATPLELNPSVSSRRYIAVHEYDDGKDDHLVILTLHGLLPSEPLMDTLSDQDRDLFVSLRKHLLNLVDQIHWLGPLRHTPDRIERLVFTPQSMSQTGKEAAQILAESHRRKTELFANVSSWFEAAFKHRLVIVEGAFEGDDLFSLALSPIDAPSIRIPFTDAGTGMSQVLPIILLGEQAALGQLGDSPVLVFENPELHLHDSIHDDLGRFFVRIISAQSNPNLIIETHSENILLALQISIAEKSLRANDVVVNWVKKLADGASIVENVVFDENAIPSERWPSEAFSTAPEQARRLFTLRAVGNRGGA